MGARFCLCFVFLSLVALAQTNPIPLVNQPLVPTTAAPGRPSFSLTVNGTGFVSGAVVNWNGTALGTTFVSESRLAATVPASNIIATTTAAITVLNPSPGGGVSNPVFFPVSVPANALYFTNSQILTTGASPSSIGVGDFNRDGKLDLAVANNGNGTVSIFLGNGDGTFQPKVDYATIASPVGITAADLRSNGTLDVAVFTPGGDISILLGNGDGTFQPHVDYPGYSCAASCEFIGGAILAADFNGDGKLDLAASYGYLACCAERQGVRLPFVHAGGFTSVFLGNGDGTFQPYINTSSVPGGLAIAAGDFNNDGKIDLASSLNPSTGDEDVTAAVALGNGDGTFALSFSEDDQGMWDLAKSFVAAADFNGDGNLDFIVCNSGNVSVLLANGDGTFQTPIVSAGGCGAAALGDFHGNGFLDLATPAAVFAGNGTGEFPESGDEILPNGSGNQAVWVSAADFNGDGKLDVVLANSNNTIWVDLQSGSAAVSPASLSLSSYIGITSAPQTVTLSNSSGAGLTISTITASSSFAQTNNCPVGGSLAAGSSCAIKVTFTPTASKTVSGTVSITDDGPGSPQAIALTGMVQDFAIATTSQTSVTVTPGQAANYAVSISPVNGFNQTVQFSCSGAPAQATCTVTPTSVTLDGSKDGSANIAVVTTAAMMALTKPYGGPPVGNRLGTWAVSGWMALVLLTSLIGWRCKRSPRWICGPAFLCLLASGFAITGCGGSSAGGGGTGGTSAGSYNLTVMGTFKSGSTTLTHATKVTLVVQ